MANSGDDKILTYADPVLRRSDLDILSGTHFINDRLIEFFFAYLSGTSPSTILLVPPSLSFLLANCSADILPSICAPLRLRDRDIIIFTVNDNDNLGLAQGGSHWSLVVFDRRADEFVHLDSSSWRLNDDAAVKLYMAVRGLVGRGYAFFVDRAAPLQRNGYDCGLHVIAAAKAICGWQDGGSERKERWFPALKEEAARVPEMRGELSRLIIGMMEHQKQSLHM